MLSDKVEARDCETYGRGHKSLFAKADIKAGEPVWWASEDEEFQVMTRAQILSEDDEHKRKNMITYSYMLDHDKYATSAHPLPSLYFNHSCNGNCWYDTDLKVVAKRDILKGEEIAYDYGLTESEASFHAGLKCACGSSSCRGVLTFSTYRDPEWVKENSGHTTDFIDRLTKQWGWHSPRVGVFEKEFGKGVYALSKIRKGETVIVFRGKVVTTQEMLRYLGKDGHHTLQVSPDLWEVPVDTANPESGDFINHSCDPTARMVDGAQIRAHQDIEPGEELTIDYCTILHDDCPFPDALEFDCLCGSKTCRGQVRRRDWRNPQLQLKYWPYFTTYLKECILSDYGVPGIAIANGDASAHVVNGAFHHHSASNTKERGLSRHNEQCTA